MKKVVVRQVVHQGKLQAAKVGAEAAIKVLTEVALLPPFNSVKSIITFRTLEQLSKSNPALQAFLTKNASVEGLINLGAIVGFSSGMGVLPLIEGVGTEVGVNNAVQSATQNELATSAQQRPDTASAQNPPTTNGEPNGTNEQQSNPNQNSPAEGPNSRGDNTQPKAEGRNNGPAEPGPQPRGRGTIAQANNQPTPDRFPNLSKKFSKHSGEWPQWGEFSEEIFYQRAVNLAESPAGGHIREFVSTKGWVFKFNSNTGEFLTIHPKGYIETFFRPKQGLDYYLKQVQDLWRLDRINIVSINVLVVDIIP